jgi:AMMECR1 domain-containing protein
MSFDFTLNEGAYLVRLARHAITDYLEFKVTIPVPIDVKEKMLRKCGVFVTLNDVQRNTEELRGCIGYPTPILPSAQQRETQGFRL